MRCCFNCVRGHILSLHKSFLFFDALLLILLGKDYLLVSAYRCVLYPFDVFPNISPLQPQQLMANGYYDITITNLVLRLHKA